MTVPPLIFEQLMEVVEQLRAVCRLAGVIDALASNLLAASSEIDRMTLLAHPHTDAVAIAPLRQSLVLDFMSSACNLTGAIKCLLLLPPHMRDGESVSSSTHDGLRVFASWPAGDEQVYHSTPGYMNRGLTAQSFNQGTFNQGTAVGFTHLTSYPTGKEIIVKNITAHHDYSAKGDEHLLHGVDDRILRQSVGLLSVPIIQDDEILGLLQLVGKRQAHCVLVGNQTYSFSL